MIDRNLPYVIHSLALFCPENMKTFIISGRRELLGCTQSPAPPCVASRLMQNHWMQFLP